jgi:hypothetical protein
LAWILQYGNFRFYTGGDLAAFKAGGYIDMESAIGQALKTLDKSNLKLKNGTTIPPGHICCFKVSHHGSEHSTSKYFLSLIRPVTGIISCGDKHGHPNKEVIEALDAKVHPNWDISRQTGKKKPDNVKNTVEHYYLTALKDGFTDNERKNIGKQALSNGLIGGDITVIVKDENITTESRFTVYWNGRLPGKMVTNAMRKPAAAGKQEFECHEVQNKASDLVYLK